MRKLRILCHIQRGIVFPVMLPAEQERALPTDSSSILEPRARPSAPLLHQPSVPLAHVCMRDAAHGCVDWFIYRPGPHAAKAAQVRSLLDGAKRET